MTLAQALIGDAPAQIAAQVGRSVVQVASRGHGHGAGTIWRSDGLVVTNHHVAPGDHNQVRLADGRTLTAETVARDPINDLAVLRVDATGLPAVVVGDARKLRVGELVVAVGHPFGVRGAVTVGMVNALPYLDEDGHGRQIVQADVLLGPGNSGGPLANARGEVVGINAMVAGGLGLAVPSFLVERLLAPRTRPATIGVQAQTVELPPPLAARSGTARAALVLAVVPGSPADASGLLLGDLIVAVDGAPTAGAGSLAHALGAHAGGVVRLGVLRGGELGEVVVLPARPEERAA